MGSVSWTDAGVELQKEGEADVNAAKVEKKVESTIDAGSAKLKT